MRLTNYFFFIALVLLATQSYGAKKWPWQEVPVEITETGDFKWKPNPFVYQPGPSVRYIDFEAGNDDNDGTSPSSAWKHHPWDPEATGKAKDASGTHTYVFKRGVVYRGELVADESGTPQNPIQLTSSPEFGTGEAMFYGSEAITGGWQQGGHPDMPNAANVWHIDLSYAPRAVWMVEGEDITRIELARTPNWKIDNPDDVMSQWWTWERIGSQVGGDARGIDKTHLTESADYYEDAVIRYEWGVVMGIPFAAKVKSFDEATGLITFANSGYGITAAGPKTDSRYYLEDKPHYLDTDGEYWFNKTGTGGRLYIRLPEGKNPNQVHIEVPKRANLITLDNQGNISISGIAFRFNNPYWDITANLSPGVDKVKCSAIKTNQGSGTNIIVKNCTFEHLTQAIRFEGYVGTEEDKIVVTDNNIQHTNHAAVEFYNRGYVSLLRNNIHNIFFRSYTGAHGHAVLLSRVQHNEVAGNIIHRTYGAGMVIGGPSNTPLVRTIIHHNKITDPLLSACDWGGFYPTGGGPNYIFSNICGNPGGYRHYADGGWGHAFYFDGVSSKNYVFNNIAWGKRNQPEDSIRNKNGFHQFTGFENYFFNNTAYKFENADMRHGAGLEAQRNLYIGNLYMDISEWVFLHTKVDKYSPPNTEHSPDQGSEFDYGTTGYANNVFYNLPENIAGFNEKGHYYNELAAFKNALATHKMLSYEGGIDVDEEPVINAASHDFRLKQGSPAINKGAKVFVPWRLYAMVGEYNFSRNNSDPKRIIDNHWYMAPYYRDRQTYRYMPTYSLTGVNITETNYIDGELENWTKSALQLNGQNQYAKLTNADLRKDITYPIGGGRQGIVKGSQKKTADMDDNNFLIEVYLKLAQGHTGGLIIGKADATGYLLEIDQAGKVRLRLRSGGADVAKRSSTETINDGNWHHVIAEADRFDAQGIRIYVDGKAANGPFEGTMPTGSLSNSADLLVGGGPDRTYLAGTLDFLRISRGTLTDAKTTIEELYAWQFTDGPQFFDITGSPITDNNRDAGAFEGAPTSVKGKRFTVAKAAYKVANKLKIAAESGMQAGMVSGDNAHVNIAPSSSYRDSVALLLNSSNSQTFSGTFTVPENGVYEFDISSEAIVSFKLVKGTDQTSQVLASTNASHLRVELLKGETYGYSAAIKEHPNGEHCTIKWHMAD